MGKPGAFVEQDGVIMPDANDEAMAGRLHEGDPVELEEVSHVED